MSDASSPPMWNAPSLDLGSDKNGDNYKFNVDGAYIHDLSFKFLS